MQEAHETLSYHSFSAHSQQHYANKLCPEGISCGYKIRIFSTAFIKHQNSHHIMSLLLKHFAKKNQFPAKSIFSAHYFKYHVLSNPASTLSIMTTLCLQGIVSTIVCRFTKEVQPLFNYASRPGFNNSHDIS